MRLKAGIVSMCMLVVPLLVMAQGKVDGTWAGEVQGGRGPQPVTLTLKSDGDKLTGSIAGGRGGEVPISEGTISGNMLKFKTTQAGRGGEITMTWTGTLKGDEIAMSRTIEGGRGGGEPQEFVLKRK